MNGTTNQRATSILQHRWVQIGSAIVATIGIVVVLVSSRGGEKTTATAASAEFVLPCDNGETFFGLQPRLQAVVVVPAERCWTLKVQNISGGERVTTDVDREVDVRWHLSDGTTREFTQIPGGCKGSCRPLPTGATVAALQFKSSDGKKVRVHFYNRP